MIKKGIRPQFRLALDNPAAGGFRQVLPLRRSWLLIVIIALADAAFLDPAVAAFQQAAMEWGRVDDLFNLVAALFMTAWLIGWSMAPLLLTLLLFIMMFGREIVRAGPGYLEVFLGIPGIGFGARYDVSAMRNLRLVHPGKKSGKAWRGPHAMFDYGANSGEFGSSLDEYSFAELKSRIEMASGKSIRSGLALASELEGDWKPAVKLSAVETGPEVEDAAISAAEPVTLASPSTIALIVANLVPLAGAVLWGWDLALLMVLYWAESAVIGLFNVLKIIVIGRWFALLGVPFFAGHFGGFMSVHFLFIYGIFVKGVHDNSNTSLSEVAAMFTDLLPALAILFASHALSFFTNFIGRKEYRGREIGQQMTEPYSRIVFMHLVLILGGGVTLALGESTPVLLVVIVLKVFFDIRAHLKERQPKSGS